MEYVQFDTGNMSPSISASILDEWNRLSTSRKDSLSNLYDY